jgi:uncharacterized protein
MTPNGKFKAVCIFVQNYLKESAATSEQEWLKSFPRSAEYRWQHTLNVLRNAEKIITGEKTDEPEAEVIRFAAVLHDVSMFVCDHEVHGRVSAEIAKQYLQDQGYPTDFVEKVSLAVEEHGSDLGLLPIDEQGKVLSWAGKVLIEADILDKLGASTIATSLLMSGARGKLNHECRQELMQGSAMQRALFFKDYIWTRTGKKLAKDRFNFFLKFLDQLAEEVVEGHSVE